MQNITTELSDFIITDWFGNKLKTYYLFPRLISFNSSNMNMMKLLTLFSLEESSLCTSDQIILKTLDFV